MAGVRVPMPKSKREFLEHLNDFEVDCQGVGLRSAVDLKARAAQRSDKAHPQVASASPLSALPTRSAHRESPLFGLQKVLAHLDHYLGKAVYMHVRIHGIAKIRPGIIGLVIADTHNRDRYAQSSEEAADSGADPCSTRIPRCHGRRCTIRVCGVKLCREIRADPGMLRARTRLTSAATAS